MKPSTDEKNQPEPTCEKTRENTREDLARDDKKNKPGKSNSELMAEFFAIISDEEKKE